jgi:hypothetical protein
MLVKDTFRIEDLTVFLGYISQEVGLVRPCDCEIILNGKVVAYLHINGEALPLPEDPARRSISTGEKIDLESLGLGSGGFVIRPRV